MHLFFGIQHHCLLALSMFFFATGSWKQVPKLGDGYDGHLSILQPPPFRVLFFKGLSLQHRLVSMVWKLRVLVFRV